MTYPILSFYNVYYYRITCREKLVTTICAESTEEAERTIFRMVPFANRIHAIFVQPLLFAETSEAR